MSTTLKTASGNWEVDAPNGVTVTPKANSDGTVASLDIAIDYTQADLHDPQLGSILSIHFQGPEPNPTGAPETGKVYTGLVVPTTIEVKNDTGGDIHGYSFYEVDDDFGLNNRFPKDFDQAHPDDYAHFHNVTQSSLVDQNGTSNATITLQDPNLKPGAFGAPGAELSKGLAAPSWINADGTIKAGAIEKLVGIASNGGVTIHSEDKPGEFGGSFSLNFYPYQVDPATIDTGSIDRQHFLDNVNNPDLLPPIKLADNNPNPIGGPGPGDPLTPPGMNTPVNPPDQQRTPLTPDANPTLKTPSGMFTPVDTTQPLTLMPH